MQSVKFLTSSKPCSSRGRNGFLRWKLQHAIKCDSRLLSKPQKQNPFSCFRKDFVLIAFSMLKSETSRRLNLTMPCCDTLICSTTHSIPQQLLRQIPLIAFICNLQKHFHYICKFFKKPLIQHQKNWFSDYNRKNDQT